MSLQTLPEDLIFKIAKYNPIFSLVEKKYNEYYKKINNAARIIQKYYRLHRIYIQSYCEFCGEYHVSFRPIPFFHSYLNIPYNGIVEEYWNDNITDLVVVNITNNDTSRRNYNKRERKINKKKLITKKQQIKRTKLQYKKFKKAKINKRKYSFR